MYSIYKVIRRKFLGGGRSNTHTVHFTLNPKKSKEKSLSCFTSASITSRFFITIAWTCACVHIDTDGVDAGLLSGYGTKGATYVSNIHTRNRGPASRSTNKKGGGPWTRNMYTPVADGTTPRPPNKPPFLDQQTTKHPQK